MARPSGYYEFTGSLRQNTENYMSKCRSLKKRDLITFLSKCLLLQGVWSETLNQNQDVSPALAEQQVLSLETTTPHGNLT